MQLSVSFLRNLVNTEFAVSGAASSSQAADSGVTFFSKFLGPSRPTMVCHGATLRAHTTTTTTAVAPSPHVPYTF